MHHTVLRQIRLGLMRWTKTILPLLINAAVQPSGESQTTNPTATECLELLKPAILIRRSLLLDSTTPVQQISNGTYQLSSFYPVRDIWVGDQDHR